MNGSIRVSAKTVEDAITEASIQLGITSDKLEYEVIEKGSTGFLGIGMKQAVIEARRKVEEKQESYQDQVDLKMEVARFEAGYLDHAFSRFGNIREAAASLGMDSSTFVRKRQKYEQLGLMKSQKKK